MKGNDEAGGVKRNSSLASGFHRGNVFTVEESSFCRCSSPFFSLKGAVSADSLG